MYNKQVTQSDGVKQNVLTNTTTMYNTSGQTDSYNLKGLLHRAEKICDRECDKVEEKQLLSNAFIACGFPISDVDRIVQNYKPKTEEEKLQERENVFAIYTQSLKQVEKAIKEA